MNETAADSNIQSVTHPPLMPGVVPAPRPVWPVVLGVIAMVFGSAGALQGLSGLVAPLILPWLSPLRTMTKVDMFAAVEQWRSWVLLTNSAVALAGGLLVFGGVLLVRRRPAARRLIMAWAFVKILLVCLSSYVGYHIAQAQMAAMAQSSVNVPANMGGMIWTMNIVGIGIGVLWGWALPTFMLIWFARRRIRADVRLWS